jgi:hypothetical protein
MPRSRRPQLSKKTFFGINPGRRSTLGPGSAPPLRASPSPNALAIRFHPPPPDALVRPSRAHRFDDVLDVLSSRRKPFLELTRTEGPPWDQAAPRRCERPPLQMPSPSALPLPQRRARPTVSRSPFRRRSFSTSSALSKKTFFGINPDRRSTLGPGSAPALRASPSPICY